MLKVHRKQQYHCGILYIVGEPSGGTVDAGDLVSFVHKGRAGSNPASACWL